MRTAYRFLSTAVALGAVFPIGTQAAYAEEAPVKVETAAWFWAQQTSGSAPGAGVGIPNVPTDAPVAGVPKGKLAVAYKGEKETNKDGDQISKPDKETYLAWDIYFVPEGSWVDSFTFTLTLDPDAEQMFVPVDVPGSPAGPARGGQPPLIACVPTIGFGEGEGDAFGVKPEDDCADQIFAEFDAVKGTYTFDATTYAQDWVDGKDNFGLGIRPALDAADPFQLVFKGAADVTATIAYTPAAPEPTQPPTVVDPVLPPLPPTDTSTYVPDVQPQPRPQPQPTPAPVVMTRKPAPINNIAARPLTSTSALSPVFWFAMIGGVLLIGTMSLILGDPLEPVAAGRRVRTNGRHRLNVPAGVPVRPAGQIRPRTV